MQLAYFLRFCWCWLSQSLSPSTEKNLVELHALSAAAQLFSCCYLIRIWARNGRVFNRHSLDCRSHRSQRCRRRPSSTMVTKVGLMDATL